MKEFSSWERVVGSIPESDKEEFFLRAENVLVINFSKNYRG